MDEFLKMDIFFVVSTIAVIVVAGFGAYALWRLARILRYVEHISEQVSAESDAVRADIAQLRANVRKDGAVRSFANFFLKHSKK